MSKMKSKNGPLLFLFFITLVILGSTSFDKTGEQFGFLKQKDYKHYIKKFNKNDNELYKQHYTNETAWDFLKTNIPLVDLPDKTIEETYYFRWWTYRKHIKKTPDGFVITEFLPNVPWSGKYNAIGCPAGHQIYEGRWLHDPVYIDDYIDYWLTIAGEDIRRYSFWAANSVLEHHKVHPDQNKLKRNYPALAENYTAWQNTRRDPDKILFWTIDDRDGMEMSAGGKLIKAKTGSLESLRPTLNSYMYGDALALSDIASTLGMESESREYQNDAKEIKTKTQQLLWNKELKFFTALPRDYSPEDTPVDVRENIGFVPWYFNLPDDREEFSQAWLQVMDSSGFAAPIGLTVCERRHQLFEISYEGHECQWNGPSWPFATTQILKGFSNLMNNYQNRSGLTKADFFHLFQQYAKAHYIVSENGVKQNWIDENQNPFTGDWISRTRLKTAENGTWSQNKGGVERGKDYNHSGFTDILISDLIGLKPRLDNVLEIRPLIPDGWNWFALDRVKYHNKMVTIIWDKTGEKYDVGKGFLVFVDGIKRHQSAQVENLEFEF